MTARFKRLKYEVCNRSYEKGSPQCEAKAYRDARYVVLALVQHLNTFVNKLSIAERIARAIFFCSPSQRIPRSGHETKRSGMVLKPAHDRMIVPLHGSATRVDARLFLQTHTATEVLTEPRTPQSYEIIPFFNGRSSRFQTLRQHN